MRELILASQSPRRAELLKYLDIPFSIVPSCADETINPNEPVIEEIKQLAYKKAVDVFNRNKEALVVGSDTVVVIDNEILGKPKNQEEAFSMLKKLSNRTHQVITGVCLISKEKTDLFASVSDVTFHELSDEEIIHYIETEQPFDKAGAYAIQGKAGLFIDRIDGDYYSIMGLPISLIYQHLKSFE